MADEEEVILIVDDSKVNRQLLNAVLVRKGYRTALADNGREAVQYCQATPPTLVLMDINMPVMDGLEATRQIKQLAGDRFIPIMFVTASDSDQTLKECIDAGGDDFISKPINPLVLEARLSSLLRTSRLYAIQYRQRRELLYFRKLMDQEHRVAEKIFANIAHSDRLQRDNIQYRLKPMSVFSGDVLFSARSPIGHEYILLGDFTGHGLVASVGSLPTAQTFYAMAEKGFPLLEIVREINRKLVGILPTGMFMAAAMVEIDHSGQASCWCGGLPDGYLLRQSGDLEPIRSRNLAMGILPSEAMDAQIDHFLLRPGDRLYLFSDGVTEAVNGKGQQYGDRRLVKMIQAGIGKASSFSYITRSLDSFVGANDPTDDVTLIEYRYQGDAGGQPGSLGSHQEEPTGPVLPGRWGVNYLFDAPSLREFDPATLLVDSLMRIHGLQAYRAQLGGIIAELFRNALEHGLLQLPISDAAGNCNDYQEQVQSGLAGLHKGWIRLDVQHNGDKGGDYLKICIEDSGPGFDYLVGSGGRYADRLAEHPCLGVVYRLCRDVSVVPPGNRIVVHYGLS